MKKIIILFLVSVALTGCDQARQKVADLINPPTADVVATRIDQLIQQGEYQKAIEMGETFFKENSGVSSSEIHIFVSKAYLEIGDSLSAVRHMSAATSISQQQKSSSNESVNSSDASVVTGPNGTVVRAGDAQVVLPK